MSVYQFKGKLDGNYEDRNPQTVTFRGKDGKSVFAIGCNTSFQRTMFFQDGAGGALKRMRSSARTRSFRLANICTELRLDVQMFFPGIGNVPVKTWFLEDLDACAKVGVSK